MPKESSKTREWEKERRNRLNEAFTTLCKLLPCYDPAVNTSKIEILRNAATYIEELQSKLKGLIAENTDESANKLKGEELKKLQDRIKQLLCKNEQLCSLLRDAKISIPSGCSVVKKFKNPSCCWSHKISPEQAKILQKKEHEKENNVSIKKRKFTTKTKTKMGVQNGTPKHRKAILNRSDSRKVRPPKKKKSKALTPSKCVILLSQPSVTQPCYVITNAPSNNNILGGTSTVITNSGLVTNPLVSSKVTKTVSSIPPLGPGTLIFSNGTIMPVVPQQTVLPLASQIITRPPIILLPPRNPTSVHISTTTSTTSTKSITTSVKTLPRIKPKFCFTKTTQVNKVPIPALTSRYSNPEVVLKKAETKPPAKAKPAADKKKEDDKKTEAVDGGEKRKLVEKEDDTASKKTRVVEEQAENEKIQSNSETVPPTGEKEKEVEKNRENEVPPPKISEAETKKPEENLELNLNHSELSNDIFASLQVPAGCQNPESTSPTAAFLLAFPLVSSLTGVKVTEVTEEDNTESQRETPTLLQIGTMDSTKPTQSESLTPSLLNLDNLSFFSSKDISGFYNSFEGSITTTTAVTTVSTASTSTKPTSKEENGLQQKKNEYQQTSTQQQHSQQLQQPTQQLLQQPKQSQQQSVPQIQHQQSLPQLQQPRSQLQQQKSQQHSLPQLQQQTPQQQPHSQRQQQPSQQQPHSQRQQQISQPLQPLQTSQQQPHPQLQKQTPQQSLPQLQQQTPQKPLPQLQQQQTLSQQPQQHQQQQSLPQQQQQQHQQQSLPQQGPQQHQQQLQQQPLQKPSQQQPLEKNQLVPCFENRPMPSFAASNSTNTITQQLSYQPKNNETKQSTCTNYASQKSFPCNSFNEASKISTTCSYGNTIKSYPEPLYTNSSTYTYGNSSDLNFNQNYYKDITKTDNRSYYSLNYENYTDYRKNESAATNTYFPTSNYYPGTKFNHNSNTSNNSNTQKNKSNRQPINWMTTPDNRLQTPSDYVLPQFTKETDFYPANTFTNSHTTYPMYTNEVGSNQEPRKGLDLPLVPPVNTYQRNEVEENQFSWSPTKIPQFLEPPPSFVSSTLPTLVGDLALGNTLSFGEQKTGDKCQKKDARRLKNYEGNNNQSNFLSVSQLVDHNKEVPARTTTRRNSGNRSSGKKVTPKSSQRKENKEVYQQNKVESGAGKGMKQLGYSSEVFCDTAKSRNPVKNSYSAEALIGQMQDNGGQKNRQQNYTSNKPISVSSFLHDNIIPYFPTVDLPQDNTYIQQNQNYQTSSFGHNFSSTFQNNTYTANNFIPPTTTISSTYNFMHEVTHDYSDNLNLFPQMNKDKSATKNSRNVREQQCPTTPKKSKRKHSNDLPGFVDFPFLSMPGSINSPILPDDFHTHTGFLQPPAPQLYPCKNPFTKPNDLASGSLLPLPPVPVTRSNIQHPEISPSINSAGTSLTNFNLSTIFPEINNKSVLPDPYSEPRIKEHSRNYSSAVQVSFNDKPTFSFSYINTTSQTYNNQ